MSERVELQLPPKQYCEWDNPDGYRHALIMNGNDPRLIVFIGGQSLNIDDPRIVLALGAMYWRMEVERLEKKCEDSHKYCTAKAWGLHGEKIIAVNQEDTWREAWCTAMDKEEVDND